MVFKAGMTKWLIGIGFLVMIFGLPRLSQEFDAITSAFECKEIAEELGEVKLKVTLLVVGGGTKAKITHAYFLLVSRNHTGIAHLQAFNNNGPRLLEFSINGRTIRKSTSLWRGYVCENSVDAE